ncbi:hypothetical protein CVT24_001776 [Panaeolus cyanescens]|uniref:Uncharacterized protein n=1 Tax=Panaeolus cyanescens TaxID=181874 RepID=A0A409YU95_9AGAR|nr:hypothetical protein CVT24_001776 [Panaeolus cyanescens]
MSRYSKLFSTAKSTWSKNSQEPFDQSSASIPGYSYPPTTTTAPSHESNFPMASSPPHPYTLAAIHSSVETRSIEERERGNTIASQLLRNANAPGTPSNASDTLNNPSSETRQAEGEKGDNTRHAYRPSHSRARNLHAPGNGLEGAYIPPPLPIHLRPIVLFFIFIPIPPLLALIYMAAGHGILQSTQTSPTSVYRASILTSVEAGATGGVILSIPLVLLFYIFLYPNKPTTAPEDFFEDDTSSVVANTRIMRYIGYLAAVLFAFCIGGIAGPLGVTCLSNGSEALIAQRRMLSPSAAAAAGFIGGLIVAFGLLAMSIIGIVCWTIYLRHNSSKRSQSLT